MKKGLSRAPHSARIDLKGWGLVTDHDWLTIDHEVLSRQLSEAVEQVLSDDPPFCELVLDDDDTLKLSVGMTLGTDSDYCDWHVSLADLLEYCIEDLEDGKNKSRVSASLRKLADWIDERK